MLGSLHPYIESKWISIRKLYSLCVCGLLLIGGYRVNAQESEIGLEIGGYNYAGDLVRSYDLENHTLGAQFFWRRHLNEAFSIRLSVGAGKLKGKDDQAFDVFSANRSASFEGNFQNMDFIFEYHFLDYRNEKLQQFWSPYLLFGAGVYRLNGEDNFGTTYSTGVQFEVTHWVGYEIQTKTGGGFWVFQLQP